MVLRAWRWLRFLALSMRLEVRMEVRMSSRRKSAMRVRVRRLQIRCSCSGQTSQSSGRRQQSCLRVSSLTQLFILLRTSFWKRQQRLTAMLLGVWGLYRFNRASTMRWDFSFFWMQERMRRMMLGTTLRFSICLDFLDFLWLLQSGLYSSSSIFLTGRQFLKLGARESLSVLQWPSAGSGLRIMLETTDFLHSALLSNFSEGPQFWCMRVWGSIQGQPPRGSEFGKTKQNCVGTGITIFGEGLPYFIFINGQAIKSIQRI